MHQIEITGPDKINHAGVEHKLEDYLQLITGEYPRQVGNKFVYTLHQFRIGDHFNREMADRYVESIRSKLGGRASVDVVDPDAVPEVPPEPVAEPEPEVVVEPEPEPVAEPEKVEPEDVKE